MGQPVSEDTLINIRILGFAILILIAFPFFTLIPLGLPVSFWLFSGKKHVLLKYLLISILSIIWFWATIQLIFPIDPQLVPKFSNFIVKLNKFYGHSKILYFAVPITTIGAIIIKERMKELKLSLLVRLDKNIDKLFSKISFKKIDSKNYIYIGQTDDHEDTYLTWHQINQHVHVLGQSGAGKSVFLKNIYANRLQNKKGIIHFDLKGDFQILKHYKDYSPDFQKIDLNDIEGSIGFNPLNFGRASELKDKIINSLEWTEPYYKKSCEEALLLILRPLVVLRDEQNYKISLKLIYEILSSKDSIISLCKKINSDELKLDLHKVSKMLSDNTLSGLKADLATLIKSDIYKLFEKENTLNLEEVIKNDLPLLIQINTQTYPVEGIRLAKMLISELRTTSGKLASSHVTPTHNCTVIVDEFADIIGDLDSAKLFSGFLNRARSSKIGCIVAHQSLGDFADPRIKSQVLDNTSTTISFRQKDPETCELLAQIAGTQKNNKITKRQNTTLLGQQDTGVGSVRETQEYILHPNTLKSLKTGNAAFICNSMNIIKILNVKMI